MNQTEGCVPSDSSFILHPSSVPAAVLLIGDSSSGEMQPVRGCVDQLVEGRANVRFAATVPDASISWFPELVIVCQHWPDEYTRTDVQRLLTLFPLSRLICCYGLWCESDGRSRDVWPLLVRVPVRCAAERIRRELEVLAGARPPLSWTASRDECFLFDADGLITERLAYR